MLEIIIKKMRLVYAVAAHRELAADPDKAVTYAHRALAEAQDARRIGVEIFTAITARRRPSG